MTNRLPSQKEAVALLKEVVSTRQSGEHPFLEAHLQSYIKHCYKVAETAAQISSLLPEINPDDAYVLGLLHDAGRIKDEWSEQTFHGLVGYRFLMDKGYPLAARIALSHSFYDLENNFSAYKMKASDLKEVVGLIGSWVFNDYDYLIQLSDLLNDCGTLCTIEYRFEHAAIRHNLSAEYVQTSIASTLKLKKYFDNKCGQDIYSLLRIAHD